MWLGQAFNGAEKMTKYHAPPQAFAAYNKAVYLAKKVFNEVMSRELKILDEAKAAAKREYRQAVASAPLEAGARLMAVEESRTKAIAAWREAEARRSLNEAEAKKAFVEAKAEAKRALKEADRASREALSMKHAEQRALAEHNPQTVTAPVAAKLPRTTRNEHLVPDSVPERLARNRWRFKNTRR